MATDEDIEALSMLGGYLIFSILHRRPLPKILTLIDAGAPLWYQDDEGTSPLHAAAYIEDNELVRILIEKGAIWNAGRMNRRGRLTSYSPSPSFAVDNLHNTAADIALSMNNENGYRLIRDAGVRSGELAKTLPFRGSSDGYSPRAVAGSHLLKTLSARCHIPESGGRYCHRIHRGIPLLQIALYAGQARTGDMPIARGR